MKLGTIKFLSEQAKRNIVKDGEANSRYERENSDKWKEVLKVIDKLIMPEYPKLNQRELTNILRTPELLDTIAGINIRKIQTNYVMVVLTVNGRTFSCETTENGYPDNSLICWLLEKLSINLSEWQVKEIRENVGVSNNAILRDTRKRKRIKTTSQHPDTWSKIFTT
jgi:hypothetical protein